METNGKNFQDVAEIISQTIQTAVEDDPRIKSPETLLRKIAPNQAALAVEEVEELKRAHAAEIERWKEYDRRIKEWRTQVLSIVEKLKKELETRKAIIEELRSYKILLEQKEDELTRLRSILKHRI